MNFLQAPRPISLESSGYILGGVAILIALVCLLALQKRLGSKALPAWLTGTIAGLLIGSGATFATLHGLGYRSSQPPAELAPNGATGQATQGGGMPGGGMGAGMGGGMGGGMAGGMGRGGGSGAARDGGAERSEPAATPATLLTLIRKLELLEKGLKIDLDPDQAARIATQLQGIEESEEISNENAKQQVDAVMAVLTAQQKRVLETVELARRRGEQANAAPKRASQPSTAELPEGVNLQAVAYSLSFSGRPNPNANPFKGDDNLATLKTLRERLKQR